LPQKITRRLIMQKARRHPSEDGLRPLCKHMVSASIALPLSGSFSPFSRLTGSLSVVKEYLALRGGPRMFTPGFTGPALLSVPSPLQNRYRTITFFGRAFQRVRSSSTLIPAPPPEDGFGLFRVRSPLLTESRLLSFPPATEMFQFAGFASIPYAFRHG
jgi:hypothetical protein